MNISKRYLGIWGIGYQEIKENQFGLQEIHKEELDNIKVYRYECYFRYKDLSRGTEYYGEEWASDSLFISPDNKYQRMRKEWGANMEDEVEKDKKGFSFYLKWCTFLIWVAPFVLFKTVKFLYKVNLLGWLAFSGLEAWAVLLVTNKDKFYSNYLFGLKGWIIFIIQVLCLIVLGLLITIKAIRQKEIINK